MNSHLITFGTNAKNYWYFFGSTLCYILRKFTFYSDKKQEIDTFLSIILMSIGMMLSFFFELVSKKLQSNNETKKKKNKMYINHNPPNSISTLNYSLFVLSLALLDGVGMFFVYYTIEPRDQLPKPENKLIGMEHIHVLIELIIVSTLSYLFLRKLMDKHHWFFSGIMLLALAIILFANIGVNIQMESQFLFGMICSLFHSIYYIIYKYYLDTKFVSPYFTIGIEGTLILIPSLIIRIFVDLPQEITYAHDFLFYINALAFIITSLGYNVFIILLIRDFGPTHRTVTGIFNTVIELVITICLKDIYQKHSVILMSLGDLLLIIGVFGFNQIIIFNACNLHHDTENEINMRAMKKTQVNLAIIETKEMSKSQIAIEDYEEEEE